MLVGRTPFRSLALLLSLSVVTATLLIVVPMLSQSSWYWPGGVANRGDYATLGMRNAAGHFIPTTLHQLSTLRDTSFGGSLVLYSERRVLLHSDDSVATCSVAFVSENFFKLLGVSAARGKTPEADEQAVLLTADFANRQFGSIEAALRRNVDLGKRRVSFAVSGTLEKQFVGLGRERPDMIIGLAHAPMFEDIDIPGLDATDQLAVARGVANATPAFGILRLNSADTIAAVARVFKKESVQRYELRFGNSQLALSFPVDAGAVPSVIAGIDLNPDRTLLIGRYLAMLSALLCMLGLILAANYAVHLIAALLERLDEIKLRIVLGARSWPLLSLVLGEQTLLLPTAFVFAGILAIGGLDWISTHSALADYFATRPPTLNLTAAGLAMLLLFFVTLIAAIVPLVMIRKLVSGAHTVSQSASRLWLWNASSVLLWTLCFVALSASVLISTNTWRMRRVDYGVHDTFYASLAGARRTTVAEFAADRADIAFADEMPLAALERQVEFQFPNMDANITAYAVRVSDNFFDVVGSRLLAGVRIESRNPRRVVISESISQQLGKDPGDLIGQTLTLLSAEGRASEPYTVGGVVANIRYDSLTGPGQAVVYRPGDDQGVDRASAGSMTFRNPWTPRYAFANSLDAGRIANRIAPQGRLSEVLAARTSLENLLGNAIAFTTIGALLIMSIGLVSEIFTTVQAKKREYALYLSCGANRIQLVGRLLVARLPLVLCGMSLAAMCTWLSREELAVVLPFLAHTDGRLVVLVAIAFCGILFGVIAGIAYRNMKPNLITLLRAER